MDISGMGNVAAASSALSQAQTGDAVGITVLKKAMDIQAQNAAQLIESAAQVGRNNPSHLGQSIDVSA